MARALPSSTLRARTNRLKLPVRGKPYFMTVANNVAVGYRRTEDPALSSWTVRTPDWTKRLGLADDHREANGQDVLDFDQAVKAAIKLATGSDDSTGKPVTVLEAVTRWATDLESRGSNPANATTLKHHLEGTTLAAKTVLALSMGDLTEWRDGLITAGEIKVSSVNRIAKSLKAALNLAQKLDKRITSNHAWRHGLAVKKVKGQSTQPRGEAYILSDDTVHAIVAKGYEIDADLGILLHVLAVTGSRESQVLKITTADIIDVNPAAPSLMIWTSSKGRNDREVEQRAVPITPGLATELKERALSRKPGQPLLVKVWNLAAKFKGIMKALGLDASVTTYALRHSAICRGILALKPIQLIANQLDTSVEQIETVYARQIAKAAAKLDVARLGLLSEAATPATVIAFPSTSIRFIDCEAEQVA